MTSRKLIVDRRWVGNSGIGRYARELLTRIGHIDHDCLDGSNPTSFRELYRGYSQVNTNALFYSPGYIPALAAKKQVITIHDLILLESNIGSAVNRLFFNQVIKPRVRDGVIKVLTVSNYSRSEISSWAGIPIGDIKIVRNGLSSAIFDSGIAMTTNRAKRSLLFIGSMKKHKNFNLFARAVNLLPGSWEVTLIGSELDYSLISQRHTLNYLTDITDSQLASIYLHTEILVNTSSHEGFGMPLLEACYLGCKIVHLGVLPTAVEILGHNSFHTSGSIMPQDLAEVILHSSLSRNFENLDQRNQLARDYSWDISSSVLSGIILSL